MGVVEQSFGFVVFFIGFQWTSGGWEHLIENGGPRGTEWCCYGCGLALPSGLVSGPLRILNEHFQL